MGDRGQPVKMQSQERKENNMQTKLIRAEMQHGKLKAYIRVEDSKTKNIITYVIKYPRSKQPYYFIGEVRHDLNEHEINLLREVISCVSG